MKTLTLTSLVLVSIGLSACGGSSGGSGTAVPYAPTGTTAGSASASGNAMLGPISGATITAYAASNLVDSIGSATTASDGSYTLKLTAIPSGPLVLEMTGGSYIEEYSATGTEPAPQSMGNSTLHALVPTVTNGGSISVAITTLTEIAYQEFVKQGGTTSVQANAANVQVGTIFGLSDIVGTTPSTPSTSALPNSAAGQYEMVLAAISVASSGDSIAAAAQYASNLSSSGLATGSLSGQLGNLNNVTLTGGSNTWMNTSGSVTLPTMSTTVAYNAGTSSGYSVTPPSMIASNSVFWLKADAVTGYANGASVPSWADSSNSGINCPLHAGGTAPTYVSAGQNSMPAIHFDGSSNGNDEYVCNNTQSIFNFGSTESLTVMFVATGSTINSVGSQGVIHNGIFSAGIQDLTGGTPDLSAWFVLYNSSDAGASIYKSVTASMPQGAVAGSLEFNLNYGTSASINAWQNGISASTLGWEDYLTLNPYNQAGDVSATTGVFPQTGATGSLAIGGRFSGDVQEIVIFPTALNSTDRSTVECYFSHKYDLNLSGC